MERKNNLLIGLTFYLENSLLLSFLALIFRSMKINSVHLVTMCQMESKNS